MQAVPLAVVGAPRPHVEPVMPVPTFSWADVDALRARYADTTPPDAWTTTDYAGRYGLQREAARRQLAQMVADGKLATGETARGGKRVRVYWVVAK